MIDRSLALVLLSTLVAAAACSKPVTCAVEGCDPKAKVAFASDAGQQGAAQSQDAQADGASSAISAVASAIGLNDKQVAELTKKIEDLYKNLKLASELDTLQDKNIALLGVRVDALEISAKAAVEALAVQAGLITANEKELKAADEALDKEIADRVAQGDAQLADIQLLRADNQLVWAEITTLQEADAALAADIVRIDGTLTAQGSAITSLQAADAEQLAKIEALQVANAKLRCELLDKIRNLRQTMRDKINQLKGADSLLIARQDQLLGQQILLAVEFYKLKEKFADFKKEQQSFNSAVAAELKSLSGRITSVKDKLKDGLAEQDARRDALATIVKSISDSLTEVLADVAAQQTEIDAINTASAATTADLLAKIASVTTKHGQLESKINGVKADLNALDKVVDGIDECTIGSVQFSVLHGFTRPLTCGKTSIDVKVKL